MTRGSLIRSAFHECWKLDAYVHRCTSVSTLKVKSDMRPQCSKSIDRVYLKRHSTWLLQCSANWKNAIDYFIEVKRFAQRLDDVFDLKGWLCEVLSDFTCISNRVVDTYICLSLNPQICDLQRWHDEVWHRLAIFRNDTVKFDTVILSRRLKIRCVCS